MTFALRLVWYVVIKVTQDLQVSNSSKKLSINFMVLLT